MHMNRVFGLKKIDYDFHIHVLPGSKDSKQSVEDAIKTAKEAGLNTIAITDHDNIDSYILQVDSN